MTVHDSFNRPLRDFRISVLDRCNFRCRYCMPAEVFGREYAFLPREKILTYEEIHAVATVVVGLGVEKIRLTGGEPLLRRDLTRLIASLASLPGLKDFALTTNGSLLESLAADLKQAGLHRVSVSLDALDEDIFSHLCDTKVPLNKVLKGISTALEAGLRVKLNAVIQRGKNESEILPLVHYARDLNVPLRFIEFMDVGNTNGWSRQRVVSSEEIRTRIEETMPLDIVPARSPEETAIRYRHRESPQAEVGFISSVTQPFCQDCTRLRLSADGQLYTCLFARTGHDIRSILRSQPDLLHPTIESIWHSRADRYSEQRSELPENPCIPQKGEMSYLGG